MQILPRHPCHHRPVSSRPALRCPGHLGSAQATWEVLRTLVLQERAPGLNLMSLPDRKRDDILDMPIIPEGIFGSAIASMQRHCEAKKKEGKAL